MRKIVIGLSGGVDSAVAAGLLQKEYEVIGVTLQMQGDSLDTQGNAEADIADARRICERLGIEHHIIDCTGTFDKEVKDYFADAYLKGITPNPCTRCNRFVKCMALMKYADEIGAECYATGHYAYADRLKNGRYALRSADSDKDQAYALYMLSQEQLSRLVMPLGKYSKDRIREMARDMGLEVSEKPDSMEICFVTDQDYAGFIERHTGITKPEGDFVSPDGKVLGKHKGITHYTVGQRKGLGIAFGEPKFVKEIKADTDQVVLSDNEELFTDRIVCDEVNFMGISEQEVLSGLSAIGKIRYSHKGEKCSIIGYADGKMIIEFENPVRAATPGQAVVLYDVEGHVMCGGTIIR
ncbi:MAG: tRNA 2-thiouridine(34) synthase MnmA [Lachnospiraceae bacterium]|nr:tRNA 2-thiouridine(34) synthase MnmA [Candidatus Darwinimomas equi]